MSVSAKKVVRRETQLRSTLALTIETIEPSLVPCQIRECPSCKTRFFKVEGCNKMTCLCGTSSCYICRATIESLFHFCSIPGCQSCRCCHMFTNTMEDDRRVVEEAGSRTLAENAELLSGGTIDIGALL